MKKEPKFKINKGIALVLIVVVALSVSCQKDDGFQPYLCRTKYLSSIYSYTSGSKTNYFYNADTLMSRMVEDGTGKTSIFEYDNQKRLVHVSGELTKEVSFYYDNSQLASYAIDHTENDSLVFEYDSLERITKFAAFEPDEMNHYLLVKYTDYKYSNDDFDRTVQTKTYWRPALDVGMIVKSTGEFNYMYNGITPHSPFPPATHPYFYNIAGIPDHIGSPSSPPIAGTPKYYYEIPRSYAEDGVDPSHDVSFHYDYEIDRHDYPLEQRINSVLTATYEYSCPPVFE
jgi:hypothetical protein